MNSLITYNEMTKRDKIRVNCINMSVIVLTGLTIWVKSRFFDAIVTIGLIVWISQMLIKFVGKQTRENNQVSVETIRQETGILFSYIDEETTDEESESRINTLTDKDSESDNSSIDDDIFE